MSEKLYWPIPGTPLMVRPNPFGGGLALTVERGIPCEGHTQVFSAHCTNGPDPEDVEKELEERGPFYKKVYDELTGLLRSMNVPFLFGSTDWSTKEAVAAVTLTWLIKQIAENCENRWEKRQ